MEDKKENSTLMAVNVLFSIITLAYTFLLAINYKDLISVMLSILVWLTYVAILVFVYKEAKSSTAAGVFGAIAGMFFLFFANFFVCTQGLNIRIH